MIHFIEYTRIFKFKTRTLVQVESSGEGGSGRIVVAVVEVVAGVVQRRGLWHSIAWWGRWVVRHSLWSWGSSELWSCETWARSVTVNTLSTQILWLEVTGVVTNIWHNHTGTQDTQVRGAAPMCKNKQKQRLPNCSDMVLLLHSAFVNGQHLVTLPREFLRFFLYLFKFKERGYLWSEVFKESLIWSSIAQINFLLSKESKFVFHLKRNCLIPCDALS